MKRFLTDTRFLIAMIHAKDQYHPLANRLIQNNRTSRYYLPETVFAETMVFVKTRLGVTIAIQLGETLQKSTHFIVLPMMPTDRQTTWEIFTRYTDKAWSYVDCSILAVAQRLKIQEVLSFDHHLSQMPQIRRLP